MNLVGLAMLLGAVAAAYLAWVWVPVYYEHQQVEAIVRETANAAVKNRNDALLVEAMVRRFADLGEVDDVGVDGQPASRPAVDVRPQDVTWERGDGTLHVAFSYVRPIDYPWIDQRTERLFEVDLEADLTLPDWQQ